MVAKHYCSLLGHNISVKKNTTNCNTNGNLMHRLTQNHKFQHYTYNMDPLSFLCKLILSLYIENVYCKSVNGINSSIFNIGRNHHVIICRPHPCISTFQLVVGFSAVEFTTIPGAMLLPTAVNFSQVVWLAVPDDLTYPNYSLSDSNPG